MRLISRFFFSPRVKKTRQLLFHPDSLSLKIYIEWYPSVSPRKILNSTLFPSGRHEFNSAMYLKLKPGGVLEFSADDT